MKRFLLFIGKDCHPEGGMHDFEMGFDTLQDAVIYSITEEWEWMHVFDVEENMIVHEISNRSINKID